MATQDYTPQQKRIMNIPQTNSKEEIKIDTSTPEATMESYRKQLEQAKQIAQQREQQLMAARRTKAFTTRKERLALEEQKKLAGKEVQMYGESLQRTQQDIQKYQEEKAEITAQTAKAGKLIADALQAARGKPFAFWGLDKGERKIAGEIRDARTPADREAVIRKYFPKAEQASISQGVQKYESLKSDRDTKKSYGLDPGQVVTITSKDTKTGEVKSIETRTGIKGGGYTTSIRDVQLEQQQAKQLQDLSKKGITPIYDTQGKITGLQGDVYGTGKQQSVSLQQYEQEVQRLQAVQPIQVYKNIITGEIISSTKLPSSAGYVKAYATPEGKILGTPEALEDYMKKNRIPPSKDYLARTPEQLKSILEPTLFGYQSMKKLPPTLLERAKQYIYSGIKGDKNLIEFRDKETGDIYFFNKETGQKYYYDPKKQSYETTDLALYSGSASPILAYKDPLTGKYVGGLTAGQLTLLIGTFGLGGGLSMSTRAALVWNTKDIAQLEDSTTSNKTKIASLSNLALTLGGSVLGSAAVGIATKYGEDMIRAIGLKTLAGILKSGGSRGSIIARNIAGLSLVGLGKATKFVADTYFKSQLVKEGIAAVQSLRQKDLEKFSLKGAEMVGMFGGFPLGQKIGSKLFDFTSFIAGSYIPSRPEISKGRIALKKQPSAIQADIQLGKSPLYIYRRGPAQTGLIYEPRLDKYLSKKIKFPTKQSFFRFEETKGVKGKRISPALSIPAFVQPPKYSEMFKANLRLAKGNKIKKFIEAFTKTPVLTDVLTVAKKPTIRIPEDLRKTVISELATKGKLSKLTKEKLLKIDSTISDKIRELEFQEEQELAFRNILKIKNNVKVGFTRGAKGELIPVLYEKGTLKPRIDTLLNKKLITEQDAKFIKRQYNMWKKFGEDYVLPKEHSIKHSSNVAANIKKLVLAYPEYHNYLIKKYGSLKKAIKQLELGAKFHDLGKTSESSLEYGTPHGEKIYNVWKSKLLPKEAQNLEKGIAKAIKTHETLAGTKKGVLEIKYRLSNLLGAISPEQKLLATADRLDLMRYGMKVDPKRLPLSDAMQRLNMKIPKRAEGKIIKEALKEDKTSKAPIFFNKVKSLIKYTQAKYVKGKLIPTPYKYPSKESKKYEYKPSKYLLQQAPKKIIYPKVKYASKIYGTTYVKTKSKYTPPIKQYPVPYGIYTPYKYVGQKYIAQKIIRKPYIMASKKKQIATALIRPKTDLNKKISEKKKEIMKKGYSTTLPTAFEQLVGGVRKGARAKRKITGFEAFRFR